MKLFCLLLVTLPLLSHSFPAKEEKTITLEDDPGVDSEHAETGGDVTIQKRSGSFDYVTHLKTGLLSSIGHASASIASGSSGSSSGGGHDSGGVYKSVEYGHHGNSVEYDPWSFKKSVLNTIFQAVKAITGGVTALKGQLIKGSGYVLSASGNVVAASGDKVTDVGKAIINSAQLKQQTYGHGYHEVSVHPFAKFSSFSGASSGSSGGTKQVVVSPGPVLHTETITSYEIPPGHSSYGPPSKPPTYSSATHQYLPASHGYSGGGGGGGGGGGSGPYSNGHTSSFEAPAANYLPSGHLHYEAPRDDFNIYGHHKKLTDEEQRKAAAQLQEILHLIPNGKTEFTASKTVTLDTSQALAQTSHAHGDINAEHVDLQTYGLPNDIGPLESLSHTESITAAYGPPPASQPQQSGHFVENPSDIYRQMAKKQTAEVTYLQKHPNEAYDYRPTSAPAIEHNDYKYNNYHTTNNNNNDNNNKNNPIQDLTPIIAALEVAKKRSPNTAVSTQYIIEKNVHRNPSYQQHGGSGGMMGNYNYLPPVVQKSKYTYFDPAEHKADSHHHHRPAYSEGLKIRRHKRRLPSFKPHDYEIMDPLLFNRLLVQ